MGASIVFSVFLARKLLGRMFLLTHRFMTLSGLAALMWHVLQQAQTGPQVLVGISGGIWVAFTAYRLYRLMRRRLSAEVVEMKGDSSMLRIDVVLRKPVRVAPGEYFNIFFPGTVAPYTLYHGYSAVTFWHPPDEVLPCRKISSLSFLLSRQGSHAAALIKLQQNQRILLEGPFGKNFKLHTFENVVLAAKGIGIAGILPLALELAERKRHDDNIKKELLSISQQLGNLQPESTGSPEQRAELQQRKTSLLKQPLYRDATRKIDIFWSLESASQMDTVQEQLRSLQDLDPDNVILRVLKEATD